MNQRIRKEIREWGESLIIALILALFIRTFIVQAFKIPSGSMIPTFQVGDRIFVNKFVYGAKIPFINKRLPALKCPERGDIVVFKSPEDRKKDFIKRLISSENESVEIRDGDVYVNKKRIDDPTEIRSIYYYNRGDYGKEGVAVTVPPQSYYVLGDNSASSRDSRFWGFVQKDNIIGKAIFIYWPPQRIRVVK